MRVAGAAQHAVRRARQERRRLQVRVERRGVRRARERRATGSRRSSALERGVARRATTSNASGASARTPRAARPARTRAGRRRPGRAAPSVKTKLTSRSRTCRVGVAGRREHERDRRDVISSESRVPPQERGRRSGTNEQADTRRGAGRSAARRGVRRLARGRPGRPPTSGRSRRHAATPNSNSVAPHANACCPNSSASMIAGFASTAAAHQPRRSSGNATNVATMHADRAERGAQRDAPVAEQRPQRARPIVQFTKPYGYAYASPCPSTGMCHGSRPWCQRSRAMYQTCT